MTGTEVASSTPSPAAARDRARWRTAATLGLLFVVFLALWWGAARSAPELLDRDWVAFDRAASRAIGGAWADAYRASAGEQFPFLYPPFALWITLPLAFFGPIGSYLVVLTTGLAGVAVAGVALRRLVPADGAALAATGAATLVSGTFLLVVITGQNTAVYVAAILIGTVLRVRGRQRAAGAVWALLLVKPNVAAVFVVYAICRRERRTVEGFLAAAAVALLSTVPMGWAAWQGFVDGLRVVEHIVQATENWYGQVTVLAALRVSLDPLGARGLVQPLWFLVCVPTGLLLVRTWWRAEPLRPIDELRLVGTACLFAVAANPRLYFYDALLLVVPAAGWYLTSLDRPDRSPASSTRRRVVKGCLILAYAASYAEFGALPLSPLIGIAALVWLCADGLHLTLPHRRRSLVRGLEPRQVAAEADVRLR